MHTIPNERALARWRTLCMLPQDKLDLLEERFTREQSVMARAMAELTDAVDCPADVSHHPEEDPRLRQFGQMLVRGACLAELFRREAGHPLRALDEAEINSVVRANLQDVEVLSESPAPGEPDLFTIWPRRFLSPFRQRKHGVPSQGIAFFQGRFGVGGPVFRKLFSLPGDVGYDLLEDFIELESFRKAAAGKPGEQWQSFCEGHQPITDAAAATNWLDGLYNDTPHSRSRNCQSAHGRRSARSVGFNSLANDWAR